MFDELNKYKTGHFFLSAEDDLMKVCDAPSDKSGVYLVYSLARGKIELVYIGHSQIKEESGKNQTNILDYKSIKDSIVNSSWGKQMKREGIEVLDVYWYITYDKKNKDFPEDVERKLLQNHISFFGKLPRWNRM